MRKKLVSLGLIACMAATMAGCGQTKETAGSSVGTEAEKAKATGTITVYTSQPEADIQSLIEDYNEKNPDVTVEVFRSGTEEVISKINAEKEAGKVQADVVLVSDSATFETLKAEDLLMSYESPELKGINTEYIDKDHKYTGTKLITTGIMVNKDLCKENITGFADLTKNYAKDNVIMPSPLYSGAASYNLSVLTRANGFGWDYYTKLKDNGVLVTKGNGAVSTAVVSGDQSLGIVCDYLAIREKAKGANVEFVYPSEGSLIVTEPIGIVKSTKNETAAKSFVDYILSDDGQSKTAEIGYTPVKSTVSAPQGFKSASEIKNLSCDMDTIVKERENDKAKFSTMFQ